MRMQNFVSKLVLINQDNEVIARSLESYSVAYHPFPYARDIEILEKQIQDHTRETEPDFEEYINSYEFLEKAGSLKISH